MAAIDIVGNTVVVTGAGTMDATYSDIVVGSAAIWWVSTLGDITVTDMSTGSIFIRRFSVDRSGLAPYSESVAMEGRFGRLSFGAVTACTLTFTFV